MNANMANIWNQWPYIKLSKIKYSYFQLDTKNLLEVVHEYGNHTLRGNAG